MMVVTVSVAAAGTPVVKVNGTAITDSEFELTRGALATQMGAEGTTGDMVARSAMDQLIARILLVQAAREAKIEVPDDVVASQLQQQINAMGGREAFDAALAQAGLTEQEVRRAQKERMMMMGYVETVIAPRVLVTEDSARRVWAENPDEFRHPEQVRLWMILLDAAEDMAEENLAEVRQRVEAARTRVEAGEGFASVAREVSDDPTRERGGLIGWVRHGLLLPELEEPVFKLEKGGLSEVLRSRRGFHVFWVEDRRAEGVYPFEEIREQVVDILQQEQINEAVNAEISQRRRAAHIEVLDESLRPYVTGVGPAPSVE